ncbi:NADH:ubiquinone oxidoreductase [Rhizobium herbae]|uniref:NADH:ubiquinone oxidoreductase n=1 Tax=Rhizobium herbae TaxID=508661 RepID=A0ABS7HJ07_9HYPH|nr:NADH:ubiquinone oxidoreductase [Rhizobium herbae]MBW9066223.1 NADH:ubiquinone oxidoreductase [Rhizobium herbae]
MTRPEQDASKGNWAGTAGPAADSPAGSDPYDLAAWLKDMSKAPLHPLMQNPAAAMAAATAIGLGMTSHFAGLMFGAMESMTRTAQKAASATDETLAAEAAEPVADAAHDAPPTKTETPAKAPVKSKPVKAEKAPPVKAAPVEADKPHEQKAAARIVETQADDLKRISGIGPKLEQVLNGMGVRRYADIAAWSDKDVKRFDAQLGFGGRIVRDAWVEQAKTLMKG